MHAISATLAEASAATADVEFFHLGMGQEIEISGAFDPARSPKLNRHYAPSTKERTTNGRANETEGPGDKTCVAVDQIAVVAVEEFVLTLRTNATETFTVVIVKFNGRGRRLVRIDRLNSIAAFDRKRVLFTQDPPNRTRQRIMLSIRKITATSPESDPSGRRIPSRSQREFPLCGRTPADGTLQSRCRSRR